MPHLAQRMLEMYSLLSKRQLGWNYFVNFNLARQQAATITTELYTRIHTHIHMYCIPLFVLISVNFLHFMVPTQCWPKACAHKCYCKGCSNARWRVPRWWHVWNKACNGNNVTLTAFTCGVWHRRRSYK